MVTTSTQCCFLVLWPTGDSVLYVYLCNMTTCYNVLYFSAEWQLCHILPCVSTVWPTDHSVLWFSIWWILGRIYVFLCSVKSWSQCFRFFFGVTSWLQYSVYYCRLRPYHNDLYSLQSDHLNTLCSVTSWLQYSVYYFRLRPYHNDLCSLQGDHLIAQCVYNSEERSTITLGGLTTREEMCLVFALYYPRIDMSLCHSLPSLPTVLHSLGIQELWPWVLICLLIINFDIWFDGTIH
jgi:CRISPR/Cas system-associated endoribonuclease Cas2